MPLTLDNQDSCSPEPGTNWRTGTVQPPLCVGRYEGTDRFLGRRGQLHDLSAIAIAMATEPQYVFGAGTRRLHLYDGNEVSARVPDADFASTKEAEKSGKIPLLGLVCLLTTGGLISVGRLLAVNGQHLTWHRRFLTAPAFVSSSWIRKLRVGYSTGHAQTPKGSCYILVLLWWLRLVLGQCLLVNEPSYSGVRAKQEIPSVEV